MFDFDDLQEEQGKEEELAPEEDDVEKAQKAAEQLRVGEWRVRWDACRVLATVGAAAAPHARILARAAAKDKDADVRKAAAGVLSALRAAGVELPKGYLDEYAEEEESRRSEQKKQREAAWEERRRQREQAWAERSRELEEQDRREEERRRQQAQREYEQYELQAGWREEEVPVPASASLTPVVHAPPQQTLQPQPQPAESVVAPQREAEPESLIRPGSFARPIEGDSEEEETSEEEEEEQALEPQERAEASRAPVREAVASRVPGSVTWAGPRTNFQVLGDILPMRLERESMTPAEVTDIWETQWGIPYASRIKFEAPLDSERKWLNPREDTLPLHPAVVVLHEKAGSVLSALATAFKEYAGMKADEAEAARLKRLQQSKSTMQRRAKANERDRQRTTMRGSHARSKGETQRDKEDRRVQQLREMVQQRVPSVQIGTEPSVQSRPQRLMRELKRSSLE
mmetsp:Transcript_34890/g.108518  ORF Transcript_34890/g.108518 Transcript_34890/m.108518 type:complete len:459 (-) Transcript_34890:98-1474(-)